MSKAKKNILYFYLDFYLFTKTPSKIILSGNRRAARFEQINAIYVTRKTT
jgi:hypothetical protein